MKKSELEDGMFVITRDGWVAMVVNGKLISTKSWDTLEYYNEDLQSIYHFSKCDIVKIYSIEHTQGFDILATESFIAENGKLVWERTE